MIFEFDWNRGLFVARSRGPKKRSGIGAFSLTSPFKVARLDFFGVDKGMEKKLPQLYHIKTKISYDLGFIAIGVAMAT